MRPRLILALLASALASACAAMPTCPGEGGPPWRELRSQHFKLSTDLDARRARAAITKLETLRAAMLAAAFPGAPRRPAGVIPVIVIGHPYHWEAFSPDADGIFGRLLWQPLILMRATHPVEEDRMIKHELVHHLSEFYLPTQARWFAEGVASYFETVEHDAQTLTVGLPDHHRLRSVRAEKALPLRAVLTDGEHWRREPVRFTSVSWLLVHYLMNRRPGPFGAYQRFLQTDGHDEAWAQAFGADGLEGLEFELGRYLSGGKYQVASLPFTPPAVEVSERTLSDADVHLQRALLRYAGTHVHGPDRDGAVAALAEVNEALRQAPLDLTALLMRQTVLGSPVSEAVAREAVAEHELDWRAWMLLSSVLAATADKESQAARARASHLAEDDPSVRLHDPEPTHH